MATLSFSLTPEATGRVYELLTCLAKFGDAVSLEARSEKLTLTALNSSRTAYASFALHARAFFLDYDFKSNNAGSGGDRFTCQLYNRALQAVFKGRTADARGRETTIEQCDVTLQDRPDEAECRLVVKMVSKHGMTKTYRLTYEAVEVMHALFDKTAATQGWRISSKVLREYIEYFGPKTEQLDMLAQEGERKIIFTSFTEKIQDGKEVLKQPLETAIGLDAREFEDFHMQENVHIIISVKDFRAIVTHAETMKCPISTHFSYPTRPLQFSYQNFGIHSEFTLMTTGDYRGASATPTPRFVSTRSSSRQPSVVPPQSFSRAPSEMLPPARPNAGRPPLGSQSQRSSLREQVRPTAAMDEEPDPDSLFIPNDGGGDDDQAWEPPNYERDEEDEMLGWDASNNDLGASMRSQRPTIRDLKTAPPARTNRDTRQDREFGKSPDLANMPPTQRLSQLQGMFD
ncbi:DNA repair protein rad9 [Fulvia fulva]|uniref:DNA repair protein rad9 n=1 Tax=Passalora fulva TaxID=5499 RepID=A0A9Q8US41_PASFU|nr:DNA repair protein rad9 [Fulvia fulva]KAK4619625.1 DNA repair protein rad9 [Fulvia fulva]KAK4620448.1 DNA repair protein rad9 [Fulvia fulva]UJO20393.1 DNA repair protein rad9 [Fulvia fulva]WPV17394.1 DNA repair protein rad9 [Fulvia fulva]WPV31920.1 DNA repair protein rad9 [Fulvia fulva]